MFKVALEPVDLSQNNCDLPDWISKKKKRNLQRFGKPVDVEDIDATTEPEYLPKQTNNLMGLQSMVDAGSDMSTQLLMKWVWVKWMSIGRILS